MKVTAQISQLVMIGIMPNKWTIRAHVILATNTSLVTRKWNSHLIYNISEYRMKRNSFRNLYVDFAVCFLCFLDVLKPFEKDSNSETKTCWNRFETVPKHHGNPSSTQMCRRKSFLLNFFSKFWTLAKDRYIPIQTLLHNWIIVIILKYPWVSRSLGDLWYL